MAQMPSDQDYALQALCALYLRPAARRDDLAGVTTFVWVPPLTTAEQATFADLQLMTRFGIASSLTLAEFQAMKPDLATGKTYLGLSAPTNAQTVAAVKAIIRVLGDLLRSS